MRPCGFSFKSFGGHCSLYKNIFFYLLFSESLSKLFQNVTVSLGVFNSLSRQGFKISKKNNFLTKIIFVCFSILFI